MGHVSTLEFNFDGLVGPTHNYAGLSPGNLLSAKHARMVAHPKAAALQGIAKMRHLMSLGVPQGVRELETRFLEAAGELLEVFGSSKFGPKLSGVLGSST